MCVVQRAEKMGEKRGWGVRSSGVHGMGHMVDKIIERLTINEGNE